MIARPLAGVVAIAAVVGVRLARQRRGGRARTALVAGLTLPLLALATALDAGAPRLAQRRS